MKGFILSLLPESGTMGSKWGGVRATDSSTSLKTMQHLASDIKMHNLGIIKNLETRLTGYALN